MRYLNTVYVNDHQARISRTKGSLLVSQPSGKVRVPMEAIDGVIIIGGAQITTDAIAACAERNIRVACMRRSGKLRFAVGGPSGGNVHLRSAQHAAAADPARRLELARVLVAGKLQNSRRVLLRWARDAHDVTRRSVADRAELLNDRLSHLASAPTEDHVRGIEGDAARLYFGGIRQVLADSGLPFQNRQRRPPRDPTNAALGFCYSLLVTEAQGAAEAVGLDAQIGFLHRLRPGRPSLALDLVEELRPLADRFVVSTIRRRQLTADDFVTTPGGAVYLSDAGRKSLLSAWEEHKGTAVDHALLRRPVERWALPTIQATLLARHLRDDLPIYPPFVLPN